MNENIIIPVIAAGGEIVAHYLPFGRWLRKIDPVYERIYNYAIGVVLLFVPAIIWAAMSNDWQIPTRMILLNTAASGFAVCFCYFLDWIDGKVENAHAEHREVKVLRNAAND